MINESSETELLKRQPKIREALEEASGKNRSKKLFSKKEKNRIIFFLLVIVASVIARYLLQEQFIDINSQYIPYITKFAGSLITIGFLMLLVNVLRIFLIKNIRNPATQYNLKRILNLVATLLVSVIMLTALNSNWYAAIISLGLISLILGFALQNPITSFFAWIYIIVRKPYEVGDRIKIGPVTGDVIEVGYLDTTLWEFNGDYLSGDHPSGRIIHFSNSKVFNEYMINYSWPLFPYIWTEIKFHVGYDSNLDYISTTMKKVVEAEIGEEMMHRVKIYRNLLEETPIDEMEVNERPSIIFRASENTWLEVVVRFLAEPKKVGIIKMALLKKLVVALREEPGKVIFPNT
jgi:small-conductance mechanosensitive channel